MYLRFQLTSRTKGVRMLFVSASLSRDLRVAFGAGESVEKKQPQNNNKENQTKITFLLIATLELLRSSGGLRVHRATRGQIIWPTVQNNAQEIRIYPVPREKPTINQQKCHATSTFSFAIVERYLHKALDWIMMPAGSEANGEGIAYFQIEILLLAKILKRLGP